ncbi:MAG: glutamate 5-kinase [Roseovarius sp.]|nr:glutamate 5-kinase [Roseovarius sp.]MCY4206946.1 glutamate 5-kinase [Roseovarius sp.]MCY4292030.1 glutamate 5-kinase [Roseovarius sp.]MCY4315753.1 glutamate 5-kinase [Roseovarius sp.]
MATVSESKRLVIKIGSSLLVDSLKGSLRHKWLNALVEDVAWVRSRGTAVILVSSGSIALGRVALGLPEKSLTLEQSQAAAAVGQIELARAYAESLSKRELKAAQLLVTLEDSTDRRRYLNTRATIEQLLELGVVPIVNENDTVATDEIRYGDNDRLAAQVAVTAGADLLILLSDVEGLYSENPKLNPNAVRIDIVESITPEIEAMAGGADTGLGKGGMKTKIIAARTATSAGCDLAITEGTKPNPVRRLHEGAPSTWFAAQGDPKQKRKAWISGMKPKGKIKVDSGAVKALENGGSLLAAGVTDVIGRFSRGDPVEVLDDSGNMLGQGLIRYDALDADRICGLRTGEITRVLGYPARGPLIHRDDLVF